MHMSAGFSEMGNGFAKGSGSYWVQDFNGAALPPQPPVAAGSHAMVRALAELLSSLTANISIILGPSWDQVRCLRVELYPKSERRLLMVLVLENAMVRTTLADLAYYFIDEVIVERVYERDNFLTVLGF